MARHLSAGCRSALTGLVLAVSAPAAAAPPEPASPVPGPDGARLVLTAQKLVRISLIRQDCALFYAIDQAKLQETENALLKQALDQYGEQRLQQAIIPARSEQLAEIQQSGAAFWCPLQRAYFNSLGVPGMVGRQRQ